MTPQASNGSTSADHGSKPQISRGLVLKEVAAALSGWLADRLGVRSVILDGLDRPASAGVSNETIVFDAVWDEDGATRRRRLVLRVHPHDSPMFLEADFANQFALLERLHHGSDVVVPEPMWFESSETLLGEPFFVMAHVEGRVPISNPTYNATGWVAEATPAQRRRLWVSAMEQLCSIHNVPIDLAAFLAKPRWGADPLDQQLNYWIASVAWATGDVPPPELVSVCNWLVANRPESFEPGLSWGDARIGNMLFGSDFEVSAVLDWEQASPSGGLLDLGWWLFYDDFTSECVGVERLDGLGGRDETIAYWQDQTGRCAEHLAWYEAFAGLKLATLTCRLYQLDARVQGQPLVETNVALERTLALLERTA